MRRSFFNRFRREVKDYPETDNVDATDTIPNLDKIIRRQMRRTRLLFRLPVFIFEIILALVLTFVVPVAAGWLAFMSMKIVGDPEFHLAIRLLAFWYIGAATIGGVGLMTVILISFWSALKDTSIRLLKLIRDRE